MKIVKVIVFSLSIVAILGSIIFFGIMGICKKTCSDVDKEAAAQVKQIQQYDNTGVGDFYNK